MRRRLAYLFLILSASPATAQALTTAQLQQIATQDAINAGIPPNVFLAQIQAESGFNPNIGCNAAGACGIAQFIPATATQFGINPNDPVASLQAAAQYDAQLEAQTGSLIGALTAYSGGCTPASPCNAGYTQAFQLAAADANGGGDGVDFAGGDGVAFGDGSALLVANPGAPPAAAASPSALPFEWVYNQVINGIMGQVDTSIQTVESITSGPATAVLALAIAIMGMMTMFGNMDMAVFLSFAIRAAIVMAFVQVGNTFYSDWIEQFVLGLPTYFSNAFSLTVSGGSPAQLFDAIMNGWMANVLSVWHSSPWSFHAIFIGFALGLTTLIIVLPSLVAMFTVFLISTFLLLVMLTIGPLMILGLLFRTTHRFLHGYVNVMVTGAIFALVVDIVLGIFSSILNQVMANFTPSGSPDTDLPGLFGLAVTMLITGFSMARLPRLVEAIGGGVAVTMDTAGRMMAGGFAKDVAEAGAVGVIARNVL
jgi:type IV secretory pathway VirB2 component (pilin)